MTTSTQSVIGQQSKEVQSICTQFTQSYNQHRKTVAEWGRLLQAIRDSNLNPVDAEGKPLEGNDVQVQTFSSICKELGVPRSTAYHYINIFLVTSTYPEWLQEAATTNNLNLAAQHVQDAYESMRETIPASPDAFQVSGIVSQLKQAKPQQTSNPQGNPSQRFRQMLHEALEYANKHNLLEKTIAARLASTPAETFTVEQAVEFLKAGWKANVNASGQTVGMSAEL
jgi:hypothetical protein